MKIFSYGSNMSSPRIRARVPSARFVDTGRVVGRSLRFHKKGRLDASGKANILHTGSDDHRVWGVVWTIDPAHKPDLDRVEGLGAGYEEERVRVRLSRRSPALSVGGAGQADPDIIEVRAYVADPAYIDDGLLPYRWYLDFVVAGAREHGLPDAYVREIARREARPDPNEGRRSRNRRILEERITEQDAGRTG